MGRCRSGGGGDFAAAVMQGGGYPEHRRPTAGRGGAVPPASAGSADPGGTGEACPGSPCGGVGPEACRLFPTRRIDSGQCRRHGGGNSPGDFGTLGTVAAGESVSGAGLWAHRKAAVPPADGHGRPCDGGSPTAGKSCMGQSVWIRNGGHWKAGREFGSI